MKSKDFFTRLKETGAIESEDFDKLIESVPEFEIPDPAFEAFESNFLTRERAISDPEVDRRARPKILAPIDKEIKAILEAMGHENKNDILKENDTYKKIAILTKEIPAALQRAGKGSESNEEFKKKLEAKEQMISELTKKFETAESEYNQKIQESKTQYETQLKDYKLQSHLQKLSSQYTFAEAFEKTRDAVEKVTLSDLRSKYKLDLVEKDGGAEIHVLNEDGSPRFNGNTPVTIKHVMDEAYKPFLKVSNGQGSMTNQPQQTTQPPNTQPNPGVRQGVRNTVRG